MAVKASLLSAQFKTYLSLEIDALSPRINLRRSKSTLPSLKTSGNSYLNLFNFSSAILIDSLEKFCIRTPVLLALFTYKKCIVPIILF
ncbi:hypothetical protein AGMMS49532_00420 [Endomicrobiia bacterium]|nr:hypothetical protein AGMMS49532_00420 [Endomicrobiia bacterium]